MAEVKNAPDRLSLLQTINLSAVHHTGVPPPSPLKLQTPKGVNEGQMLVTSTPASTKS